MLIRVRLEAMRAMRGVEVYPRAEVRRVPKKPQPAIRIASAVIECGGPDGFVRSGTLVWDEEEREYMFVGYADNRIGRDDVTAIATLMGEMTARRRYTR